LVFPSRLLSSAFRPLFADILHKVLVLSTCRRGIRRNSRCTWLSTQQRFDFVVAFYRLGIVDAVSSNSISHISFCHFLKT
jgi:hypothetical protein